MDPAHYGRMKRALDRSRVVLDREIAEAAAGRRRTGDEVRRAVTAALIDEGAIIRREFAQLSAAAMEAALVDTHLMCGSTVWPEEFPASRAGGQQSVLDLSGADFSGCIFIGCNGSPLNRANFQRAQLDETRWFVPFLELTDFTNASLRGCDMNLPMAKGAIFRQADVSGSRIRLSGHGSDDGVNPVDFSFANLVGSSLVVVGPAPPVFTQSKMQGCRIRTERTSDEQANTRNRARLDRLLSTLSDEQRREIVVESEPIRKPWWRFGL